MKTIEASPAKEFLNVVKADFYKYKMLGDKTFAQLENNHFYQYADETNNCIATLIQHISGNLISRFTDFLTTDGEKENRNRDSEFQLHQYDKEALLQIWEKGFYVLFQSLEELSESDLSAIIYIRNEVVSVPEALIRSLSHITYHIGQIILLAKQSRQTAWKTLSIEKGKSADFNLMMREKYQEDEA